MMIDVSMLEDGLDAAPCRRCGHDYVFEEGKDTGYCKGCTRRLKRGGRPSAQDESDWKRRIAERADQRTEERVAERARRRGAEQ